MSALRPMDLTTAAAESGSYSRWAFYSLSVVDSLPTYYKLLKTQRPVYVRVHARSLRTPITFNFRVKNIPAVNHNQASSLLGIETFFCFL